MNTQSLYCSSCKKNYDINQEDLDLMQQYDKNFNNSSKGYTDGCFFKNLGKIKRILAKEEEFIIYNISFNIHDYVSIGQIEINSNEIYIWLEEPYEMVGPFSLNELETNGQINFAACFVMSKQKYKQDKIFLREESFKKQQKAQEQFAEDVKEFNKIKAHQTQQHSEREHRELLCLPVVGTLEASQIKTAYRLIIKEVHPDIGGSHDMFIKVTKARDTLLHNIK
jgi:curved DNA-binding protein CbpA